MYVPSLLAMLAGNVLLLSSALVLNGLLILLIAILAVDGLSKNPDRLARSALGASSANCQWPHRFRMRSPALVSQPDHWHG
jgi:hypothetical protein